MRTESLTNMEISAECLYNTEPKIANSRVFDDKGIGRYTYYSPMGASTIDYVISKLKEKWTYMFICICICILRGSTHYCDIAPRE